MTKKDGYRSLKDKELKALCEQGCTAADWDRVEVEKGFDPDTIRHTTFLGDVKLARQEGTVTVDGIEKPAGIDHAVISNCTIGRNVRIANVGVHIDHYIIGDHAVIENVGRLQTNANATFGNGTEVEALNEGGGREVLLYNELTAQVAYLMCVHRYRGKMIKVLTEMVEAYVADIRSDMGTIGEHAQIISTREMIDVAVGPYARINGAASLTDGSILSSKDAPTTVGADVTAEHFIMAEAAKVTDGAVLGKTFVGQAVQVGKQFSAENSLFFANCEAFHGEACSIFAGPYTVTHHKSTLLIAGLFSFYNAGSGTNQSNHMYKLGPVHEGKVERGTKTGSFSYMMWPCTVGPFGVVLGKHTGTFDTTDYPFSHHEARPDGRCLLVPGLNLVTVGTVRDGAKWPTRDRRKGCKRDLISFPVFSPYTVGKMIRATNNLKVLQKETSRDIEEVMVGGALVKRPILRTGQKFYRTGIEMYLLGSVVRRLETASSSDWNAVREALKPHDEGVFSEHWVDVAGLLMPHDRLEQLHAAIEKGEISGTGPLGEALQSIHESYGEDEWLWVRNACQRHLGKDLDSTSGGDLIAIVDEYLKVRSKFLKLVIADAEKEFAETSQSGFGRDAAGEAQAVADDFEAVRGSFGTNSFVNQMEEELASLEQRMSALKKTLEGLD